MRTVAVLSALAAASAVHANPTQTSQQKPRAVSLEPITATGNAFFAGDKRFFVRGVAYQPGGSAADLDPLADPEVCLPDIEKFKDLGLNVVRVYSTDNSKDHKECMDALAEAGIYVALDANNPKYSINRAKPARSYNADYLQSVFATIDEFIKYPNTMAFFSGNEVIHDLANTTLAAPFVKATTRDMRSYIKARGYRKALVGYSAADVSTNRIQTAHYFNCGTEDERSDFFAFNDYSWCDTDYITAGWDKKVEAFTGYGLPIFLSEYGCTTNGRTFGEIEALMSGDMTPVYSGGLMYEYTNETNGFGILRIEGDNKAGEIDLKQTGERVELPEFASLSSAMVAYPAPTGDAGYTKTTNSVACPTQDDHWAVEGTLLPAMPSDAKKYLTEGAGKGPGLKGVGSQDSGTDEVVEAQPGSGEVDAPASSSSSTATSSSAANGRTAMGPVDKAPFVISGIVVFFTLVGAIAL
ncbi:Glucanosyltransferase-domain-containing protein [Bombardia bombarda]|uniref:1,3-beta-glucanosyltransferase n=1 Tax=Bombardia bombarda TaxID=252184 RepID=A0AA39XNJ7_9PEZI|nr:Glucanosyltransferase-domain-containing protein [Bombardia bombarda]